eukprot:6824322-Pyramimonas_sp.AAC.1
MECGSLLECGSRPSAAYILVNISQELRGGMGDYFSTCGCRLSAADTRIIVCNDFHCSHG